MVRHEIRQGTIGWVLDNMYTTDNRTNACMDEFLPYISRPAIIHSGRRTLDEFGEFYDERNGDFYDEEGNWER